MHCPAWPGLVKKSNKYFFLKLELLVMELRQLEYFVAVSEEANFTRAAERVHVSQSGVSAQVRQLERDLGAPLIDRSGRVATLTAAGAAALPHARVALAAAAAVRRAVDDVTGLLSGRIVVGMVTACTVAPLFDALAAFHLAHPGIEIALVEGNSDGLVEQVRAGAADLALIGAAGAPPGGLDALTIVSEGLVAAVPPGHPLAGREAATLAEVTRYPIISLPPGTGVRAVFDQDCATQGRRPDIAFQASAPGAVADLATRGLGVAILTETMAAGFSGQLAVVVIKDVVTPALLALVWARAESPALRELLVHSRQAFAPQPPG
jgi:DNA-binding transcriptional LysR family regulator